MTSSSTLWGWPAHCGCVTSRPCSRLVLRVRSPLPSRWLSWRPPPRRGPTSRSGLRCHRWPRCSGCSWLGRPSRWLALLLTFVGLTTSLVVLRGTAWQLLAQSGDASGWAPLVASVEESAWWVLVAVALLCLFFPDGRLPSPRWRWVPAALVSCTLVNQVYGAVDAVPFLPPLANLERPFGAAAGVARGGGLRRLRRHARPGAGLRGVARRAVPTGRCRAPGAAAVAVVQRAGGGGVPPALPGRDRGVGAHGVAQRCGWPGRPGPDPPDHRDRDPAIRPVRRRQGAGGRGHVGCGVGRSPPAAMSAPRRWWEWLFGQQSSLAAALATALGAAALAPLLHRLQGWVDRRLYPVRRAAFDALDSLHHDVTVGSRAPEELEPFCARRCGIPPSASGTCCPRVATTSTRAAHRSRQPEATSWSSRTSRSVS